MKPTNSYLTKVIFGLIATMLLIPLAQNITGIIKETPLNGDIQKTNYKSIDTYNWFNNSYQQNTENVANESFGFRTFCIRLNNQIAYSVFNKLNARSVLIGKNNYLFELNYIKAYLGQDYLGEDSIKKRMFALKNLHDSLTALNKNLIIVFAAGKASFYPEHIPSPFDTIQRGKTNYEMHIKYAKELGLNFIDFNKWFVENKNSSPYPLYPKTGIHWSYYGSVLACDSIIKYIEHLRKIDMNNPYWDEIDWHQAQFGDNDISKGLNLLLPFEPITMGYPNIKIESDSTKEKPRIMVISDSFYWTMYNFGISRAFSRSKFWFYNNDIYPDNFKKKWTTKDVDLKDEIDQTDIVLLMATEATLAKLGWGFIENAQTTFKIPIK